jgi:uncharacterized YigZ family protein
MRYRTPAGPFQHEPEPSKGSRFIAMVHPVSDAEAAMTWVRGVEAAHPDVDHCCWAWRLRDGNSRTWDAAEPRGSAGRPILSQIEGHAIFDVAVAVLRHFGGTKLGVGGLIRAYGGAAGMALDRAPTIERADTVDLVLRYAYDDTQGVEAALLAHEALTVRTDWAERVHRVVRVDAERATALLDALRDRSAGRVQAERA